MPSIWRDLLDAGMLDDLFAACNSMDADAPARFAKAFDRYVARQKGWT